MSFTETIETVRKGVDAAGVALMIGGMLVATSVAVGRRIGGGARRSSWASRCWSPERPFFSFSVEVDLEGRRPWQRAPTEPGG